MGSLGTLRTLLVYSLAIVGLLAVLFVVFSYGWDGEPPEISVEASSED